ncbi:MAG TPA: hypothetical protein VGG19_18080 [Tepidisphaeraceae bacterium]|jgi:hypothetical protein
MKSDADQIREYVWIQYIEPARHRGDTKVSIKSGDIVKGLNLKNKTPNVCTALRSKIFQTTYGVQLVGEQGPPSGMSTTVVFTYKLENRRQVKSESPSAFERLRGIAKGMFPAGEWERSIRKDRRNFYAKTGDPHKSKRG